MKETHLYVRLKIRVWNRFGIEKIWNPSKVEICCGLYSAASMHNKKPLLLNEQRRSKKTEKWQ